MGHLRENIVYRQLPSHLLQKGGVLELLFHIPGLACHHRCFQLVALWNCQGIGRLQYYCAFKPISKDTHHFWAFYRGWVLFSEHFYWSYIHCVQEPSQQGSSNISITQTTGPNCYMDEVNSFSAMDYLHVHQLSSGKVMGEYSRKSSDT